VSDAVLQTGMLLRARRVKRDLKGQKGAPGYQTHAAQSERQRPFLSDQEVRLCFFLRVEAAGVVADWSVD